MHPDIAFGYSQAQEGFANRNKDFCEHLPNLTAACRAADIVGSVTRDQIVIKGLVRLVIEDFYEIVLLCANSWTTGAMKILRGMFERSVTACYLQKHPDERHLFADYWFVSRRKAARRVKEDMPGALPENVLSEVEADYDAVKDKFQIGRTNKISHHWNSKDIISMAKELDFDVVIYFGYYTPMTETHPTMGAIIRRVRFNEQERSYVYQYGLKPDDEQNTLICASYLLIRALDALRSEFNIESLEPLVKQCFSDYVHRLKAERDSRKR